MENGLRGLMRMSSMIRNWTFLSNYAATLQNSFQKRVTYSQDTSASKELKVSNKNIENHLHSYDDPISILQADRDDSVKMDGKSAVQVVTSLYKELKEKSDSEGIKGSKEFLLSKDFCYLCERINKDIRHLETHEIMNVLKIMTHLQVPTETVLIQTLLQMLRGSVSHIPVEKIPFLHFLLRKHEKTPLVEALLIALPLVFQNHLRQQLDRENITSLTQALSFACNMCGENEIITIADALTKHGQNIDLKNATAIHESLAKLQNLPTACLEVLFNVQEAISKQAKDLIYNDVRKLLRDISRKVLSRRTEFYHENLIDALSNVAVALNVSFSEGAYIVSKLNNMDYSNIPLLDYLAAKCFEDPSILVNCRIHEIQCFIRGFTIADYKPMFWDTIGETILSNNIGRDSSRISALHLALNLTALDCCHPELLRKAFSLNIEEVEIRKRYIEKFRVLLLYQSVKTLCPEYTGPWPSTTLLEQALSLDMLSNRISVKTALEHAVGGSQYVKNQLKTKLGHFVDHVIVIQPGGQPVAVNSESNMGVDKTFIEEIQSPPGSRTILIFNFPKEAYSINSRRLKSTWSLILRSAEALTGFRTIAIDSDSWRCLPDHEKIPYLKQSIKLKCDDILGSRKH